MFSKFNRKGPEIQSQRQMVMGAIIPISKVHPPHKDYAIVIISFKNQ